MFVFNQLKVPTNVEEAAEDDPLAEVGVSQNATGQCNPPPGK